VVPRERRLLAALGPRKLELARDRFGGAVTLLADADSTRWTRERLGPTATLAVDQLLVLDEDPQAARAAARGVVGFLAQVGGYAAAFARMGFDEAAIREVSDELIDATVVWGDEDRVLDRIRHQEAAGADHVVLGPLPTPGAPDGLAVVERLAERLECV
ncbi:MAG: LLM class F420-dependent oxidoreductase, partial [Pseudonocardia sp.]